MINDTLDLARIESGHIELETRALNLGELVAAVMSLLAHDAEKRGIRIDVRLFDGARAVRGDHTRVKQILTNLLSNAVKYNVDGGRVLISSHTTARDMVALEVGDTGEGMDAAQLAQLFQPFNRLGRESGPVQGTGIGLVISLRLAELMGGTLRARTNAGGGSTFILELPRVAAAPKALADDGGGDLPAASYRQRVVHYIEDNETNAEVMRGIMALRPQVKLEISALGLDGLSAIRERRPSLILLDMHLPDVDGLELLRHLQADPDTADIPVIVVSADATRARIDEALAAGATHYLTKPVNVPQFLAALDDMLEQLDTLFG
jgi:CheY-like chemotaxis protein/two-component sensor histidine kinase